jgi:hypothetical protein
LPQTFTPWPGRALKTGESWTQELKVPNMMGEMAIVHTFTAAGGEKLYNRDVQKVTFKSTIKTSGTATTSPLGPIPMQAGEGTGDGEVFFDYRAGRLVRAVTRQTMPVSMSVPSPDGNTLDVAGTTKTTTTVDLIEK